MTPLSILWWPVACSIRGVSCSLPMSYDLLRGLVNEHMAAAIELAEANGTSLSSWRVRLLERLGRCGDPHHGFVWWRCDPCGEDRVVALSCKQRLVCPRCGARRMAQTAAHLVDHVLPEVPYRQWVIALPRPLHQLLAWRPDLLRRVGRTCFAAVQRHLLHRAGVARGAAGGLVFIQSFTETLGRYVHLHLVATDGVFIGDLANPSFLVVPPPTRADLEDVAGDIALSLQRIWARLPDAAMPLDVAPVPPGRGARPTPRRARGAAVCVGGVNLQAAVRLDRADRRGLQRLLRYAARPAWSMSRLRVEGHDVHLYTRDGQRALTLTAPELLLRLAAVAMPPGVPLLRYLGAFAPNSPWRPGVVLSLPPGPVETASRARGGPWAPWAHLIIRVFGVDPTHCPRCGGAMRRMADVMEPSRTWYVLGWLDAQARGPPGDLGERGG